MIYYTKKQLMEKFDLPYYVIHELLGLVCFRELFETAKFRYKSKVLYLEVLYQSNLEVFSRLLIAHKKLINGMKSKIRREEACLNVKIV